jgi:beta-glucosidase
MIDNVSGDRLPTFTEEEAAMVKGSYDYIGLNHYTSSYIMDDPTNPGGEWFTDSKTKGTKIGINGQLIGPQAESTWLNVYAPGMRGILKWIDKRYNSPLIYVFENGVSVPKEN